jgi:Cu/Ag efflux protein CusF
MKNVRMVLGATALALSSALGAGSAFAQAQMPMGDHAQMSADMPMASSDGDDMLTQGEIKRIDPVAGKLTIKHGDIRNLDMPGMTMVFYVAQPAMLNGLKVGDKIQFVVEMEANSRMVVTRIEPAR